ncbi:MAG: LPXTG cell wall anchor domain-containing protein [Micromonosporaceae bacterium]|nr:LPXTG cell wall anchor domain-containing protein [Micromonosporaceae bacterium]
MTMRARLAGVVAGGALALFTGAVLAATGGTAAAAEDPTMVDLRQSDVTADDPEFDLGSGNCEEKLDQGADEDIWVFVWPGNAVEELVSLTLNFDTDGDGTADTTLTESDATPTLDNGTLKVWVSTPAGWTLVDGTSEVIGAPAGGKFNLTHSCAGTSEGPTPTPTPVPTPSEPGEGEGNGNGKGGGNGEDDESEEGGLPVTGIQVGGLAAVGAGLLAAGAVALLAVRRRRGLPAELTEPIEG